MIVKTKLSPTVRFPSYVPAWDIEAFEDLVEMGKKKHNPAKDQKNYPCVELEHIESETGRLLGTAESRNLASIKTKFRAGDVLYGKLRPYLKKYVLVPFEGVCSSEIWVFRGKAITNQFLFYLIQNQKFDQAANMSTGSKMPRADWSYISSIGFGFPSPSEQQKIASFLSSVDERIELLVQKKEKLEAYKKGVMQQIFSQQIRFKQDDGSDFPDWEERKLGEVTYKTGKKNKEGKILPTYSINNQVGFLPQSEQFDGIDSFERGFDTKSYKIVEKEMFAYNPARINVGSLGFSGDLENVLISSLYVCFKTTDHVEPLYLLQFMKTYAFNKAVLRNTEGGVRDYLFYDNFSKIRMPFPSLEEQRKIVSFLQTIDNHHSELDRKTKILKSWKKGLLQQMFV